MLQKGDFGYPDSRAEVFAGARERFGLALCRAERMRQDMTCFVGIAGADAPGGRALLGRIAAAARAEGGTAQSAPAGRGTQVFGFAGTEAALRFARAAVTQPEQTHAAALRAGVAMRGARHADAPAPPDGVAAHAAELAAGAAPGHVVVSAAVPDDPDDPGDAPATPRRDRVTDAAAGPAAAGPAETLCIAGFELDTARFELRRDGVRIAVEPRTFDLLVLLARNIGRTVTRDEILQRVWGGRIVSDAALSSQIKAARQALGDDGRRQRIIATVHGRGFRLRAAAAQPAAPAAPAEGVGATESPLSRRPTLVALPFGNLDEDGRGAIVARGLTEDLINALTRTRWLCVIPRNPAFAMDRSGSDPDRIAQALGADYLLSGSLRRAGNRVRITAQATDVRSMQCLWSESFDREMRDIFDLQEEIAALVAARLATELGISEQRRAARTPRTNLGAWELYQLGSAEFYRFTPDSNRRCRALMRQAIRLDSGFGAPHARLAYAIVLEMVYFEGAVTPRRLDEALTLAETAVACDDQDADALFTLGRVRLARRDYDLAIDALEQAVRLNPCHALSWCGHGDSLAYEGRIDEALQSFDRAIALGPHDPFRWAYMSYRALAHIFAGEFRQAAGWARRAAHVPNAHYWARANLLAALGHLGARQESRVTAARLLAERPGFTRRFAQERLFYLRKPAQMNLFLEGLRRAGIP